MKLVTTFHHLILLFWMITMSDISLVVMILWRNSSPSILQCDNLNFWTFHLCGSMNWNPSCTKKTNNVIYVFLWNSRPDSNFSLSDPPIFLNQLIDLLSCETYCLLSQLLDRTSQHFLAHHSLPFLNPSHARYLITWPPSQTTRIQWWMSNGETFLEVKN